MALALAPSKKTKTKTNSNSIAAMPNSNTITTTTPPLPLHPPYLQMITEAISSLKDRSGSSQPAIVKFIQDKHNNKNLPTNFRKILSVQLKKFVKSEKLVKVKNSYKVASATATVKLPPKRKDSPNPKLVGKKKAPEKGVKTKRLSQVKTPEVYKQSSGKTSEIKRGKMKQLDQVKTPQGFKRNAIRSKTAKKKGKN